MSNYARKMRRKKTRRRSGSGNTGPGHPLLRDRYRPSVGAEQQTEEVREGRLRDLRERERRP